MKLKYFEIHLTDHCNLNCKCCDNFSPLAEPSFISQFDFERDLSKMKELAESKIKLIRLLGGEPLLHPSINELLTLARFWFSKTEIRMTTNGIKLPEMPESFWATCRDNNITVEITYYPIKYDHDFLRKKSEEFGVKIIPFGNIEKPEKHSYRNPINDKKDQDIEWNFKHCYQVGSCISLKNGKLYPCSCIPNICHFNKYFGKNLEVTEKDYIDIHQVCNLSEIEEFLDKSVPFCGYCNVANRTKGATWGVTKRDIKEWFDE